MAICTFCGKDQEKVEILIEGPDAHICGECVAACQDVILENKIYRILKKCIKESKKEQSKKEQSDEEA